MDSKNGLIELIKLLLSAAAGSIGTYIVTRGSEKREKNLCSIKCFELLNEVIMLNKDIFGPMSKVVQIKSPENAPESPMIDICDLFYAKYVIRNFSDDVINEYYISLENKPSAVWFDLDEGGDQQSPLWNTRYKELIEKQKVIDPNLDSIPIPYLNPYNQNGHEVILKVASYLPLDSVKIVGGEKGIDFDFEEKCKEENEKCFKLYG